MTKTAASSAWQFLATLTLALALAAGARGSSAQTRACGTTDDFPRIPVWAFPGAYRDSSFYFPSRCVGSFAGPWTVGGVVDSVVEEPRTVTVRWLRDRFAELRPDFGGYRIYRLTGGPEMDTAHPDTSFMQLIRRFSVNAGDQITWNFSLVDTVWNATRDTFSLPFLCNGGVANDTVLTFIDPDSSGSFFKVCRLVDRFGHCRTPGDSVFRLIPPPGPHDGFRTWYTVTYEALNTTDNNYTDMFIPDTLDGMACCGTLHTARDSCPNLNHKALNLIAAPVEPSAGPVANLQQVRVVPNPFRAREAWDQAGGQEVHFVNLPEVAKISIYTVAGDLVTVLHHNVTALRSTHRMFDFERWNLKNGDGRDVASGIYMYRVESGSFAFQDRFIVIR